MKAIGFNQGLRGDLVMSTVAAHAFKENEGQNPSKLYIGMNKQFHDMAPLFYQHDYFDSIHLWDEYDHWPSKNDKKFIQETKFDWIFHPMCQHTSDDWYKKHHQCAETCLMHGLRIPTDNNLQCSLSKWFVPYLDDFKGYIAFAPIGAAYAGFPNNKSYNVEIGTKIVQLCIKLGYKVIQIGGHNEYQFDNVEKRPLSYFDSVKTILACKALITVDTGLNWVSSAYNFPTLACYKQDYYQGYIKNIQPINNNSIYLNGDEDLNNIDFNLIVEGVKRLLDA